MKEITRVILLTLFVALSSVYFGFYLGEQAQIEKQKAVIKATFAPVEDCLIIINYSGRVEGEYWTVSDFKLHQDWERNKNRDCEIEVGELLYKFINSK